jgi:ADP-ribose pyrophosphatase YjhB (NUDIX family)
MNIPARSPLDDFSYCPHCGAAPLGKSAKRAVRCPRCGLEFYFNCTTAVAAFLLHQNQLVLGIRAEEPQKGMLDLPGGFVEFDETAEEALRREVLEEFNVEIIHPVYLTSAPNDYFYGGLLYKTTDLYFLCEVADISTLKAGDDVASYEWVDPMTLDLQKLAFSSGRMALRRLREFLQSSRSG